jgi:hypothetical protein
VRRRTRQALRPGDERGRPHAAADLLGYGGRVSHRPSHRRRPSGAVALLAITVLLAGCGPASSAAGPTASADPSGDAAPLTTAIPGDLAPATGAPSAPAATVPGTASATATPRISPEPSGPAAGTPGPTPSPVAFDPPARPGRFALDLYDGTDHVGQYDAAWCVPASMQMMINLMADGTPDRTRGTQRELYELARTWSPWLIGRPGASTHGWIGGLEALGYGDWADMALDTRQEALQVAARQMRLTRKPVGLLVWNGKHAWVMSGFRATADPAYTDDFRVTAVWVEDPWHGRVSALWGEGVAPHTLIAVEDLARDYRRWASIHRPENGPRGKFVIVAPLS